MLGLIDGPASQLCVWPVCRGLPWDDTHAFVVEDGKLITARWAGDAFLFTRQFMHKLEEVNRLF